MVLKIVSYYKKVDNLKKIVNTQQVTLGDTKLSTITSTTRISSRKSTKVKSVIAVSKKLNTLIMT